MTEEQIDGLIRQLVNVVVEHNVMESCAQLEAARVRLAMAHPSPLIQARIAAAEQRVVDALEESIPDLLNSCLGLEE